MSRAVINSLASALRKGAWFGGKTSLALFGSVFLAVYGSSALWLLYVRIAKGARAMQLLIESEGGKRALQQELWISAGRVVWLTVCCMLLSAVIFAVCTLLSERASDSGDPAAPHPLDG